MFALVLCLGALVAASGEFKKASHYAQGGDRQSYEAQENTKERK